VSKLILIGDGAGIGVTGSVKLGEIISGVTGIVTLLIERSLEDTL
jgi:hypothetical protein